MPPFRMQSVTSRRVLVCAPVMPEFDRESGSRRVFQTIELLRDAGWAVSLFAENVTDGERYARMLGQRGVMVFGGIHSQRVSEAALTHPTTLFDLGQYDLVIVAFWHLAETLLPLVRACSPATRVIVDSIDVHFLRQARQTFAVTAEPVARTLGPDFADEMRRELNVYAAADGVLTVSEKEAALINDFLADPDRAYAVPDTEDLPESRIPCASRTGLLFVGNFRHRPNVDAATFLLDEIVPHIDPRVLERHPISIVGNALTADIQRRVSGLPHVHAVGWVPSVLPYVNQARVSLVPLTYGAGTKRKVIEALSVGTPCVTTSVGAEGLGLRHGEQALIADAPAAFAEAIERLATDEALWRRLRTQGRVHMAATHGRKVVSRRLEESLARVLEKTPGDAPARWLGRLSAAMSARAKRTSFGLEQLLRTLRLGG